MNEIFDGFVLFNYTCIIGCELFPNLYKTMQTVLHSAGPVMFPES